MKNALLLITALLVTAAAGAAQSTPTALATPTFFDSGFSAPAPYYGDPTSCSECCSRKDACEISCLHKWLECDRALSSTNCNNAFLACKLQCPICNACGCFGETDGEVVK